MTPRKKVSAEKDTSTVEKKTPRRRLIKKDLSTKKTAKAPRKRVKSVSSKATKSVKTRAPKKADTTKKPVKHIELTKELIKKGVDLSVGPEKENDKVVHPTLNTDIFDAPLFYDYDYGVERIVFLPIDPTLGFVYWDFRPQTFEKAFAYKQGNLVLRFYDVTNIDFNGYNANEMWDVKIYGHKGTWYLRHSRGNRNLMVEIGVLEFNGVFTPIGRSNISYFPSNTVSSSDKVLWMTVDEYGNKVISEEEDFTKEDLRLLKKLLGDELFDIVFVQKKIPTMDGSNFRIITEETVNLTGLGGVSSFFKGV